jgi:DNA-binding response OmpR family regulator
VSALFAPDGLTVEGARTGDQALRLLRDHAYDLVIADAQLLGVGEKPFVNVFLDEHPEWRDRLVITASGRTSGPSIPLAAHRIDKPFNLRDLRALAGRILAS